MPDIYLIVDNIRRFYIDSVPNGMRTVKYTHTNWAFVEKFMMNNWWN